jgi:transposase
VRRPLLAADNFEVAEATYRAAMARWPTARITLRQGIRVVHDTGQRARWAIIRQVQLARRRDEGHSRWIPHRSVVR